MSSLPSYVAAAKPVPAASRAAWYKNVAPTYAGIMLWFVFWEFIVTAGGAAKPRREFCPGDRDGLGRAW